MMDSLSLMQKWLMFVAQACSADRERDFKLMNVVKVKSRNRLEITYLDHLKANKIIFVCWENCINLHKAYILWMEKMGRRDKHSY